MESSFRVEEAGGGKFWKKIKEQPVIPIGLTALALIVGHGVVTFKKRNLKLSMFLIHYRVAAQGAFVGCLTLAVGYSLFNRVLTLSEKKE